MKKNILILFLLMIVVVCNGCVGELSNINLKLTEPKEDRQLNDKQIQQYIESFGIVKYKLKQRFIGDYTTTRIRGVYGDNHRNWIRAYEIRASFMERPFEVWIDNRTHEIFGDNFYEVLSRDDKFQHLYSEWVKKQVGIEDENVELKFAEAMQGARLVGDNLYIDFNLITDTNNIEEQICKNIHNLYVTNVRINNFYTSNVNDILEKVKSYEKLIKPYVFDKGDNRLWFGVYLKDSINDKKDPYKFSILFDYNTNEKKYYIYYENRPLDSNKTDFIDFE